MSVIDNYLAKIPADQRTELERVRTIIMKTAPEAEDTIGYGMPVLKYHGKYLIGFAPFKQHMSIFPGAGAVEALKDQLTTYTLSKGTVQFTLEKPLPEPLLRAIVQWRVHDIDQT